MERQRNVFLVGPMGAGKTTIGRRLAKTLRIPFWDSDHEIERRTGVDIPTIFEFEGEQGFRRRETRVLDELTQRSGIVLATGGGAIMSEGNRQHLKSRGFVVYLRTPVAKQLKRTARDRNRPLLQTQDPEARLEALMNERGPLYCAVADLIVDTDQDSVPEIVKRILAAYNA